MPFTALRSVNGACKGTDAPVDPHADGTSRRHLSLAWRPAILVPMNPMETLPCPIAAIPSLHSA